MVGGKNERRAERPPVHGPQNQLLRNVPTAIDLPPYLSSPLAICSSTSPDIWLPQYPTDVSKIAPSVLPIHRHYFSTNLFISQRWTPLIDLRSIHLSIPKKHSFSRSRSHARGHTNCMSCSYLFLKVLSSLHVICIAMELSVVVVMRPLILLFSIISLLALCHKNHSRSEPTQPSPIHIPIFVPDSIDQ
jgi:hypothetical protein